MALRAVCELSEYFSGVAAEIPAFEGFDGMQCARQPCALNATGDGYAYCAWDTQKTGCRESDWAEALPPTFACTGPAKHRPPVLLMNGGRDPLSNISGQITYPLDPTAPGVFNTSFPPVEYVTSFFLRQYGCDASRGARSVSFYNGTVATAATPATPATAAINSTLCHSWPGCSVNVTTCISDAGHRWYGDVYDRYRVCRYEGYDDAACNLAADLKEYGPNTQSFHATEQTLAFFQRISDGV
jgi:hypothetical protein